jgi:hypothetical protein
MKILYLTKGDHVDYQNDCLHIGLKELFGCDVVDYNKQHHNYVSYDEESAFKLYGKGMTVTRVIPDIEVDRTDITNKIKNKFFDFVVYGSIWRCNDHINEILKYYEPNKIIAVDGEDETNIHNTFNLGIPYFKRELTHSHERLHPISFAFPTSKINFNTNKIKTFSYITPLNQSTYIYRKEQDYYNDYSEARIGVTLKRGGWDCLRHYEILANGCLPYFLDIERCPKNTMTTFPKDLCKELISNLKTTNAEKIYADMHDRFKNHFLKNNTTKQLATSFINTIYDKI